MLPQFIYILIFYRVGYNCINIHGYFFFGIKKKIVKSALNFYFISNPSILFDYTQCKQIQRKEVYEHNLISARVVLMNSIKMANIELQALICIFMTSYTFVSRCEG